MKLTFCQFSDRHSRRPVEIDPMQVVKLMPGTREVARGKSYVETVAVLTVVLDDGSEYVVFDALRTAAKRIVLARAAETERAAPVAGSGPSPA